MKIEIDIDDDKLKNLLCCALEGGSSYWYMIDKAIYPPGTEHKDFAEGGKCQGEQYWHWAELIPFCEGGAVIFSSKEGDEINGKKKWRLNRKAILRGLNLMREEHSRHFADFLAENEDACTGDVFLQLCLFGKVVYG